MRGQDDQVFERPREPLLESAIGHRLVELKSGGDRCVHLTSSQFPGTSSDPPLEKNRTAVNGDVVDIVREEVGGRLLRLPLFSRKDPMMVCPLLQTADAHYRIRDEQLVNIAKMLTVNEPVRLQNLPGVAAIWMVLDRRGDDIEKGAGLALQGEAVEDRDWVCRLEDDFGVGTQVDNGKLNPTFRLVGQPSLGSLSAAAFPRYPPKAVKFELASNLHALLCDA